MAISLGGEKSGRMREVILPAPQRMNAAAVEAVETLHWSDLQRVAENLRAFGSKIAL